MCNVMLVFYRECLAGGAANLRNLSRRKVNRSVSTVRRVLNLSAGKSKKK